MLEVVCYRASAYPSAVRPRRHRTDSAGRYHAPGSEATQYFCLHPLAPWAEVARNQGCRDVEDFIEIRMTMWAIRLVLPEEPEVIDFNRAAAGELLASIEPEELIAEDASACRALADAHRTAQDSARVIRVPSAALPGTENIVIFGPRTMIGYEAEPLREIQVPASIAAVDGRPPAELFQLVRLRGQPHAGFEAWRVGEAYRLPPIAVPQGDGR